MVPEFPELTGQNFRNPQLRRSTSIDRGLTESGRSRGTPASGRDEPDRGTNRRVLRPVHVSRCRGKALASRASVATRNCIVRLGQGPEVRIYKLIWYATQRFMLRLAKLANSTLLR